MFSSGERSRAIRHISFRVLICFTLRPNRGKYRHPHIAYAALEVHLAHIVMPEMCGPTWDHNDGAT